MKIRVTLLLLLLPFLSTNAQTNTLSETDKALIGEIGFDTDLIEKVRRMTSSEFTISEGNSDGEWIYKDTTNFKNFLDKGIKGLIFKESQESAANIVSRLRDEFRSNGYFIYISDQNFGFNPDVITILKTDDQFDIIRFEGTNGINYDIFVEDIVEKLSTWNKEFGLELVSVGTDFIEANYSSMPDNIGQHSKDLYELCPDIVDQGTGSIGALKKEISRTKQLFLWWD